MAELEQLVVRDPRFAPAWGLLAHSYLDFPILNIRMMTLPVEETRRLLQDRLTKAQMAAQEALRLDPREANAHTALGMVHHFNMNWVTSEDSFLQALTYDPYNPEALVRYGQMLRYVGRIDEAVEHIQQAHMLEPLVFGYRRQYAKALRQDGQHDASVREMEDFGNLRGVYIVERAMSYAAVGRFDDAAELLLLINPNRYGGVTGQGGGTGSLIISPSILENSDAPSPEEMAALMRSAPTPVSDPETLPTLPVQLNSIYTYIGAPNRIMETPERALEAGTISVGGLEALWETSSAPVRQTERFKAHIRNIGLDDFWRERGFADVCRPLGDDDFECD